MEIRFHNPYRRALRGLVVEILAFVGFVAFTASIALLFSLAG